MLIGLEVVLVQEERPNVRVFDEGLFLGTSSQRMTRLHDLFREPVFAFVSRRIRPAELAEDVTAQAFEAAFNGFSGLRRKDDPYLWLLGIARRKLANAYRQRERKRESALPIELADGSDLEGAVLDTEKQARVHKAVETLPEDQREALLLQHLEGLSHRQIAEVMRRKPSAINGLLQRARLNLLNELRPYFPELENINV
jgi:RNA polymerase sigma-70 factor, ECF subfamily